MKQLKKDLQTVSKALKSLTLTVERMKKRVERIEKQSIAKTKAVKIAAAPKSIRKPVTPKSVRKGKAEKTAYATFLGIVNKSKKGVSVKQLQAKTGFDDKKIRNLVFKATKQGAIKSVGRGVYVKA